MSNALGSALFLIGLFFNVVGCIGLIRLPDIYDRLHAAIKCITLGTCTVLLGTAVMADPWSLKIKCLLCLVFILIASPTAAHALARGAHASGVKLGDPEAPDQYQADGQPGVKEPAA